MTKKFIAVNDRGNYLGEYHYKSRLSDEDVELIRSLHEEGMAGYRTLAITFGVSKSTIQGICNYTRRCTTPAKWTLPKPRRKGRIPGKDLV